MAAVLQQSQKWEQNGRMRGINPTTQHNSPVSCQLGNRALRPESLLDAILRHADCDSLTHFN